MELFGGDWGPDWRSGNLPAESTSFVGRQVELMEIGTLLDEARLVTLTGVGGVGKSRLARRAGAELRAAFPDGVWLVELSVLSDPNPNVIALAVYEALPLADQTTRPVIEVLAEWLADKRLLLVLDCCEHLVAGCTETVAQLLAAAPGLRVLATSRRPLEAADERVLTVPPLPVAGTDTPDEAAPADAVVLFLQRAGESAPRLATTDAHRQAVAEICARLDGIPLAVELAAARLRELTMDQLRERLQARFDLLTAKDGTGSEGELRHQALRTTIGWSHELCAPLERLLWARLSVFAGGFDLAAAQAVCAGGPLPAEDVPQVLSGLVNNSIVGRSSTAVPRFRLLDTVREYGAQWLRELGQEEQQTTARRHRDHYLALARRGCDEWIGPEQVRWHERTVAEHADLRAAMDFCLTEPESRTAVEMAGSLGLLWLHCGFFREAERYLDRVLAGDPEPGPARSWALWARGAVTIHQGDLAAAEHWGAVCEADAARQGDSVAVAAAAYVAGGHLALRGELDRAAEVFDAAPLLWPTRDDRWEALRLMNRLGRLFIHVHLGEFDRAREVADELELESERHGERWIRTNAAWLRATAELAQGDARSAARHARAAVEGNVLLHETSGTAMALEVLASAVAAGGDGARTARLLGVGQQLWRLIGHAQLGSPKLAAARKAAEHQARHAVGDATYDTAFHQGLEDSIDHGLAYALQVE